MASSRSPPASSTHQWNYDVYISFRGEDTRKNFVGHLYAALSKRGIHTYLDSETLPHGEPIDDTLNNAIKESRIALVVFSENFAYSSWCLEEVVYILHCMDTMGQIVLPIFYHVEPMEVRRQTGNYMEAFSNHEYRNPSKVELWRKTLEYAANLRGWDIRNEAKGIQLIVEEISNILFPNKDLTEIGTHLKDNKLRGGDSGYDDSKLDVFLSFLGKDTRHKFVDHLYSALDEHDILTYVDREINFLHADTMKAIEESQISIIIFSKNFASSSICMDELAYIMKCRDERGHRVIPLYYHVSPFEVRRQHGNYEEAFSKHELMNPSKVELWRKTLKDAGSLSGWVMESLAGRHEAKGIQLIVNKISNILFPNKDIIGLQTRLGDMKYGGGGIITIPPSSLEGLKIPLHEILQATNNFSENNFITVGGFGKVYRALSEQHGIIAVKRLDRSQGQGDHEFMAEITLLSNYKHENLVSLVGYCYQDEEKILVLKYENNGSLDKHLHSEDLTWIQRLQICLDAANGMKYLHEDVGPQNIIFHRDVKSSNILLDENWKAKISDFGLSKIALATVQCSVIFTQACGTLGYVDPEYHEQNALTQKSDVYSFGVVLFEVLCSRLVSVWNYQDGCKFSARLAKNHYEKETLDEIIVSSLRSQMNSDCLSTYSTIAYQCLKKRDERPTMGRVVDQLEKALDYQQGLSGFRHDVYISFRHRDTECHVVDDICAALQQGDVSTYKDDVTLSRNESILLKAIERSRLYVIVFTKKFAVNSWYLDEVAKIIECMKEKRQFLLPVFLNVSRSDVRTQKGYFGEVMSEYDRHPRMEVWRNALVEATNAPGLEYSNFWSSADFVRKVVDEINTGLATERLSTQV